MQSLCTGYPAADGFFVCFNLWDHPSLVRNLFLQSHEANQMQWDSVPKKSLIESCDTWPGVLMSVWVLPQSKHKFMPKSRVPRAHPSKTHRGSTWEKTQTAIKALNLEGQRSVPDLATHTLHCFTFISQYNTSQQPWKEWKDIFEGCARAQILWQQCDKRS